MSYLLKELECGCKQVFTCSGTKNKIPMDICKWWNKCETHDTMDRIEQMKEELSRAQKITQTYPKTIEELEARLGNNKEPDTSVVVEKTVCHYVN